MDKDVVAGLDTVTVDVVTVTVVAGLLCNFELNDDEELWLESVDDDEVAEELEPVVVLLVDCGLCVDEEDFMLEDDDVSCTEEEEDVDFDVVTGATLDEL